MQAENLKDEVLKMLWQRESMQSAGTDTGQLEQKIMETAGKLESKAGQVSKLDRMVEENML